MELKRISCVAIFLIMSSVFYVSFAILPENARGAILYVGGSGPSNYTKIQDAIDVAFPGDTIFVYARTYNENLIINKTVSLFGENRLSTVIDGGGIGDVLNVSAKWVNISGFTVTNSGTLSLEDSAIELYHTRNCQLTDNVLTGNNYGIALLFTNDTTIANNNISFNTGVGIHLWSNSSRNLITNNNISRNSYGVDLLYSPNNIISGNSFFWNDQDNIFLYRSDSNVVTTNTLVKTRLWNGISLYLSVNNTISNNTVSDSTDGIFLSRSTENTVINNEVYANNGGVWLYYSENNTVAENNVSKNLVSGIPLSYSNNNTIVNNDVYSNDNYGIALYHSNNNMVEGNNLSDNMEGIHLDDASGNTIANNSALSNVFHGVYLYDSRKNAISYNTAHSNDRYGIYVYSCENNTIADNNASYNKEDGMFLRESNYSVVERNSFVNNSMGIRMSRSHNSTVNDNNISKNSWGVILISSSNNTVTQNMVSWNFGYGFYLLSAIENMIHHNDIINNTEQAYDDGGANQWDDGYPSGGNYWSNYTGQDLCSGPNQNVCPDPDGIGDVPYIIDVDSMDRYPLTEPSLLPNDPPKAQFTLSPAVGDTHTTFYVNASLSYDSEDPISDLDVRWDWEDDGTWDTIWSKSKTSEHQYTTPGVYTIRLEVKDTGGLTGNNTLQLTVSPPTNQPPTCIINAPISGATLSGIYAMQGSASDEDGTVESVEVRINDGPWIKAMGTTSWNLSWDSTTVDNGDHTIHARSFDGTDHSSEVSLTVTVENAPPQEPEGEWMWMVVGVATVVVVAILLVLYILTRRKKKEEMESDESPEAESEN